MAIASQLARDYEVTILGEYLPGDEINHAYVSQWAGAIWLGTHHSSPRDQAMQIAALPYLWDIAAKHPESSLRQVEMTELCDSGSKEGVWYKDVVPDFRWIDDQDLPEGVKFGMKWKTVVITPVTFLPWFRAKLEARGVEFRRTKVSSLSVLKGMGHDVLINATGFGARLLSDVQEKRIIPLCQQNIRIRKEGYNSLFIRWGTHGYYSTAFGRGDGTIYIGGVKTRGIIDFEARDDHRATVSTIVGSRTLLPVTNHPKIMAQAHNNNPELFPSADPNDYDVIGDHVGVYPYIDSKDGGVRLEKEVLDGQNIVHAYGPEAGGYTYSFGIGIQVARLVAELLGPALLPSKL